MKTKLIALLALLLGLAQARADLIQIVNFANSGIWPPEYAKFQASHKTFLDSARATPYEILGTIYPPGWVSQFGALDGGEFFFTDVFAHEPGPTAQVWWDFTGSDFRLLNIETWGFSEDGQFWVNLYKVPRKLSFVDDGETVSLGQPGEIQDVVFWGVDANFVPDYGSTIALFALSVVVLFALRGRFNPLRT